MTDARLFLSAAAGGLALIAGAAQAQCIGAGVITRIDGQPQDVAIDRAGSEVSRIASWKSSAKAIGWRCAGPRR